MCLPASNFCCGCSVPYGVKSILAIHFLLNAALIAYVFIFFFASEGSHGLVSSGSMILQLLLAGYALAGLPFIVSGAVGVAKKSEQYIRVYMLFLLATIAIGLAIVAWQFIFTGPCNSMGLAAAGHGQAFACGMARLGDIVVVLSLVGIQMYVLFIVWSYCEDLKASSEGGLSALSLDEETLASKRFVEDPYDAIQKFGAHMPDEYGSVMAAAKTGLGNSSRIFDGGFHEMNYPPRGLKMNES